MLRVTPKIKPALDPEFLPASLWTREYQKIAAGTDTAEEFRIALERSDGSISIHRSRVLPNRGDWVALNQLYLERLLKFLLWQKGGYKVTVCGDAGLGQHLKEVYSPAGLRAFDFNFMGDQVFGQPMGITTVDPDAFPREKETSSPLGRHLDGCRIGFDLGGSDRKCAAVIDGEVVFSEEVTWDPYFREDPDWHFAEIDDSLRRAAARLPRVDAIGGSSAGVYVNSEVRVASLFRGVPRDLFKTKVRRIFFDLKTKWNNVPFVVVNDGEVTALAGSMSLGDNAVLGVAMGTSLAAGYVTSDGHITNWLNELAFAPLDYRHDAPVDEWSQDGGVGAQYFSQQAVARLVPSAGIELPADMPLPEQLVEVQKLMARGDERARRIYETIGVYFGYAVAHFADFYQLRNILVLGRVMSGPGGELILEKAKEVLRLEFSELAHKINLLTPSEKEKRLGQAVVAASLPSL